MATPTVSAETSVSAEAENTLKLSAGHNNSPVFMSSVKATCDAAVFGPGLGVHSNGHSSGSVSSHRTGSFSLGCPATSRRSFDLLGPSGGSLYS